MPKSSRHPAQDAYLKFGIFGAFWGTWGASIPAVRDQAQLSDGQLGTALLFVGAGALPAMLLAGRAVDRWGQRVGAVMLCAMAGSGVVVASSRGTLSLSLSLALLGACSGAADVAINAAAGSAQHASGRPVISRAHGVFSLGVVAAGLTTGGVQAFGAPTPLAFGLLTLAAAAALVRDTSALPASACAPPQVRAANPSRAVHRRPLLFVGAFGALAFAVENGHQSWSALHLRDALSAGPVAAAGPAVFAAVVAVVRLTTAATGARRPIAVLAVGALTATVGTAVVGLAPSLTVGLLGLAVAAAGTAVLFPTLLGVLTARVPERERGAATSLVTIVAYLGYLAGPVYVGYVAGVSDLPTAMLALAVPAALLLLVGPLVVRRLIASSWERELLSGVSWPAGRSTAVRRPSPWPRR